MSRGFLKGGGNRRSGGSGMVRSGREMKGQVGPGKKMLGKDKSDQVRPETFRS